MHVIFYNYSYLKQIGTDELFSPVFILNLKATLNLKLKLGRALKVKSKLFGNF